MPVRPELEELDRRAYRIVAMICSEAVPEPQISAEIGALRVDTAQAFGGDARVFDRIYGRRFARLRTRFRPAPALFATPG
jgi:hypothetical protein